jgi:hypothetical protein
MIFPWAAHPVTLVYRQRRVRCRRLAELDGGAVKSIPWAEVRRRLAAR